jgi:hypothetical protein
MEKLTEGNKDTKGIEEKKTRVRLEKLEKSLAIKRQRAFSACSLLQVWDIVYIKIKMSRGRLQRVCPGTRAVPKLS